MAYFLVTLLILAICILAMAIGVILGKKPLKGSCGGLGSIMGEKCAFCSKEGRCKKESEKEQVA